MERKRLSRRDFITLAAASGAGALLAACQPTEVVKTVEVEKVVQETVEVERVVQETVEVEKVVQETVEVEVVATQRAGTVSWTTGMVPPDYEASVTMISWEDEGEMRKFLMFIDQFFKMYYPNVEYEIDWGVPWDEFWTVLPTRIAAGDPPDLMWHWQGYSIVYADKGWTMNLNPYIEAYPPDGWPDDWEPRMMDIITYQGEVHSIPYGWVTYALYTNREIIEPIAGWPIDDDWTWDDMAQIAIEATSGEGMDKIFGVNMGTGNVDIWTMTMSEGVDTFLEEDGVVKPNWADPAVVDAIQYLWDLRWKHGAMPTSADASILGGGEFMLSSGRVGMQWAISDVAFRVDELVGDKFPWGFAPVPVGPAGRFAFAGGAQWAIPTGSKEPDLMYEVMRYVLSNPAIAPTIASMGSLYTGRVSFAEWALPPMWETNYPEAKHVLLDLPLTGPGSEDAFEWYLGWPEFEELRSKWMDPVLVEGESNVEEALNNLQDEAEELYAELYA